MTRERLFEELKPPTPVQTSAPVSAAVSRMGSKDFGTQDAISRNGSKELSGLDLVASRFGSKESLGENLYSRGGSKETRDLTKEAQMRVLSKNASGRDKSNKELTLEDLLKKPYRKIELTPEPTLKGKLRLKKLGM